MKKVFLSLFCLATIATASAQTSIGVKAGGQLTNVTNFGEGTKSKFGFNAGAYARFHVAESVSIQPEAVFSTQGVKASEGDGKLNLNYINVPVLVQYHLPVGLRFETGPQIGFLMSAKLKGGGTDVDVKEGMKTTDFSWAFGAGYKFAEKFGVNVRYNLGLSKLDKEGDGKSKNSVFQLGLSYELFNTGK